MLFRLQGGLSKRGAYELTSMEKFSAAPTTEELSEMKNDSGEKSTTMTVEESQAKSSKETSESIKPQDRHPVAARTTRIYREGQTGAANSAKK